jgi:serine/threonine protein kinase
MRLGGYEITAGIGAGGMGEVYRARDTKLNRDVAIKVLPELFAADPDRLARFEREAQTLAALNHPNIAQIHGVLPAEAGSHGLVMEFVDGEDLAQRIARGPIPLEEAIPIARQITDALEAAHEQGIVHRDLKPANVKVKTDGTVKVLDFGLAKAMGEDLSNSTNLANSPTFTAHATQLGVILGTAAYMAPEQARGKAVDRRADIWAFGAVLFEMLTGRQAFAGNEITDVLASVLKDEVAWTTLPADVPAPVRRLLRRCLEKDPKRRLSAIGDARLELDERDITPSLPGASGSRTKRAFVAHAGSLLAGAVITVVLALLARPFVSSVSTPPLQRLSLLPPAGAQMLPDSSAVAISPDGAMVAFIVGDAGRSDTQLWVRSLDSTAPRRLEDGDGAYLPFWSPDSERIGFFAAGKLKTIAASGGRAQVLADGGGARGASWGSRGEIVYAPGPDGPVYRVSANGGAPAQTTSLNAARGERAHRFPSFLPDGEHFLYAALPAKNGRFDIFAASIKGGAPVLVASMESAPAYAEPGYLLYARQGVLVAQPFDANALRVTGDPIALDDEPGMILEPTVGYVGDRAVSVSGTGALAYFSSGSPNTVAQWYDGLGRRSGILALPPGHYGGVRISPDGARAALVRSLSTSESDLWLVDLVRGSVSPLSRGPGSNSAPIWSPDGSRVVFASDRDGVSNLYVKSVGDATHEQPLYRSGALFKFPSDWSRDGKSIVLTQIDPGSGWNVYLLPADGAGAPAPLVNGPAREIGGPLSPDGRWLAFVSDEAGRYQLYVQSFPQPGHRIPVSQDSALESWWTPDGKHLLFVDDSRRSLMRVDVTTGVQLSVGPPVRVAELPEGIVAIDATPDRQRFLVLMPDRAGTGSMTIVQHWREALDRKRSGR